MTSIKLATALSVLLLVLTACTSVPSDTEIKIQVAKAALKQGGEKIFSLENFRKVNGLSVDRSTYIAEVEYDLVFRKGLDELTVELKRQSSDSPLAALGAGMEVLGQLMQYGQFKAGDRLPRHEKYKLIKTEQGWRLAEDFNL